MASWRDILGFSKRSTGGRGAGSRGIRKGIFRRGRGRLDDRLRRKGPYSSNTRQDSSHTDYLLRHTGMEFRMLNLGGRMVDERARCPTRRKRAENVERAASTERSNRHAYGQAARAAGVDGRFAQLQLWNERNKILGKPGRRSNARSLTGRGVLTPPDRSLRLRSRPRFPDRVVMEFRALRLCQAATRTGPSCSPTVPREEEIHEHNGGTRGPRDPISG